MAPTTDTQVMLGMLSGLTHDQLGRPFGTKLAITGPVMDGSGSTSVPDAPVPSTSKNPGTDLKSQIEWELGEISALLDQAAQEGRGLTDDEQAAADTHEEAAKEMSKALDAQYSAKLKHAEQRREAAELFARVQQPIRAVVEGHDGAQGAQFSQPKDGGNRSGGNAVSFAGGQSRTPYGEKSQYSFFGDLGKLGKGDQAALSRMNEHRAYVDSNRAQFSLYEGAGHGQEVTPPVFLQNLFELAVVQVATTAALANGAVSLPDVGRSFTVPKMTSAATADVYVSASPLNSISDTDPDLDVASADIVSISGQVSMDRFLRDRGDVGGSVDVMLGQHLAEVIAARYDKYVLATIDAGAQISVPYADGSPTFSKAYPKIANLIQQIHTANGKSIDAIVVAPRRFGDWISATDSTGRPLLVPTPTAYNPLAQGTGVEGLADAKTGFTGYSIANIPVYVDGNITTTNNTSQDVIYGLDTNKLYAPKSSVAIEIDSMFAQGKFGVMVTGFVYAAAMVEHRPMAFGRVTGTGLVTPTF